MGKKIKEIYYKAGITPPKGKGEHTMAFHKMAVAIKKGQPSMPMSEAYAISMKQLGRNKSVNPSHRNPKYHKKSNNSNKKFSYAKMGR